MKLANPGSPGEMDVKNGEYEQNVIIFKLI